MPSRSKSPKPAAKAAPLPKPVEAAPPPAKTIQDDNQEILASIAKNVTSQPLEATIASPESPVKEEVASEPPASVEQPSEPVVEAAAPEVAPTEVANQPPADLLTGEAPVIAAISEVVQDKTGEVSAPVEGELQASPNPPTSVEESPSLAATEAVPNANTSGASIASPAIPSAQGALVDDSGSPSIAEVSSPAPIETETLGLVSQAAEN